MNKIYFVDGYVAGNNVIGTPAYVKDDEGETTFFYMCDARKGAWGQKEFDHQIVSTAYTKLGHPAHPNNESFTWHLLSKRGVLIQLSSSQSTTIEIKEADTGNYGYVSRLRIIGEHIYACGFRRQVYKLQNGTWSNISLDILAPKGDTRFSFRDIAGTSENNIYAVGWLGEIFHFDGVKWRRIDCPTNVDLTSIRLSKDGKLYISGKNSLLVSGEPHSLNIYKSNEVKDTFWDIEIFNEKIYLSHLQGICTFEDGEIVRLSTGLHPEAGSYRLHSNDGVLWSFGYDDLIFFDGNKWTRVVCPDQK